MPKASHFKLPLPDPKEYTPPFVTQLGEPTVDDCTWASGLMLVATWTTGEVVTTKYGRVRKSSALSQLHQLLRNAAEDTGSSNLGDLVQGVKTFWPQLRSLKPYVHGYAGLKPITFDDLWNDLLKGHCAVVQGNPANVNDPNSELKTTKADHAIYVHRAVPGKGALVMDPMQSAKAKHPARNVSQQELREFTEALENGPFCLVVERGGESHAIRARRNLRRKLKS